MTTTEAPAGVDGGAEAVQVVHDHADRLFSWRYERERPPLVTLYNKAAASQWNSVTDLDWSTDDEPPAMVLAREAAKMPGCPLATWTEKQFVELRVEMFKAQLSQFMHGE